MIATNYALEEEVIQIISKTKNIHTDRLWTDRSLQDFGFDTVDVVDIILKLEKFFKITIPDEAPINTVGDFIDIVASHAYSSAS